MEKISPPSPPSGVKPSYSNNSQGGDKGGDRVGITQKGGDNYPHPNLENISAQGGDTFEGGDKKTVTPTLIPTLETVASKAFESEGGDGGDKKTTYSNSPTVGAFQVGDRITPSNSESKRWGQKGTITVVDAEEATATVKWDIDGDKQVAKCFRTCWTSELKFVESNPNRDS